ncbi:MAG TPA: bile acid:sodium symporter [Candidatus Cloacimonadota bacterium]|nr:bile acid:sodium symporter [Candidatus Cloacimonadota bacterium]
MKILHIISQWMGELLILAIVTGYFLPFLGIFKPIVSWLLMFLLFSSFLSLDFKLSRFVRAELLLFPVLNWLIMPLLIFYCTQFLSMDYRIGLFLIIITPPALGSPIIVRLAKGDLSFAVSNVVLFNILSPVVYAILPKFFFGGLSNMVSPISIFLDVALYIFIPLVLALLLKRMKNVRNFVLNQIDPFKGIIQLFMIAVVIASSRKKIDEVPIEEALIIFSMTLIISFLMYLIAYLVCRKDKVMQMTCPISTGHKNTLLSIVTCLSNFSPIVAIPSIFYIVSHHVWNGIIIFLSKRQKA